MIQDDPGQLNNLLGSLQDPSATLFGRDLRVVVDRLDALMMVLKSCKGRTCVEPWKSLHPDGDVGSLDDALESSFDSFYAEQAKVSFSKCELGYIRESEGPQDFMVHEEWKQLWNGPQEPIMIDPDWSVMT